ncbi:MAG: PQQ-binding-like beta-propeller repeat protein [bacterium]
MNRKRTIKLLLLALALALIPAVAAKASDWPMFLNDARHSGYAPAAVQAPLSLKWSYSADGMITMPPVKAGDKVFVATRTGTLYALDAYTGAVAWQYVAPEGLGGAPAVAGGRVYFNTVDGQINCLDAATGNLIWQYTTSGTDFGTPTVSDGKIFIGTGYPNNNLLALDAATGAWLWQFYTEQPILTAPAVKDGVVWIGAGNGVFYGVNEDTGALAAQFPTGGLVYFSSPSILGDTVYATGGEYDRKIYAFSLQTGAPVWSAEPVTDSEIVKTSSISSANGKVFISIGYPNQKAVALDAVTGAILWQYNLGDASDWNFTSAPVMAGNTVYVGSVAGYLTALNADTGALITQMNVGSPIVAAPAVADGLIYVAAIDGSVKAFAGADLTPPAVAITIPAPDAIIGGQVGLSGTAADDNLMKYTLEYGESEAPSSWTQFAEVSGGASVSGGALGAWNTESLATGVYTIRLTAVDVNNNSANVTVKVNVDTSVAPQFAGLQSAGRGDSDTTANLSWDAASDADTPITYNIYMASATGAENFATAPLMNVSTTNASVSGLAYGHRAFFVVRAKDALGNVDTNTAELSYLPLDSVPPVFAGLMSAERGASDTTAILNWNIASDNYSEDIFYDVYQAFTTGAENFGAPPLLTLTSPPAEVEVSYGTRAYFVVRARDQFGNQDTNTVELSFLPDDPIPPVFAGLANVANPGTGGALTLSWSAATDNAGDQITYQIFISETEDGINYANANQLSTGTSFVLTGLTNGVQYYAAVRARDAAGNEDANTIIMTGTPTDSRAAVSISSPPNNILTNQPGLIIAGVTSPGYNVTVGGVTSAAGANGNFAIAAALTPGVNTIAALSADPVTGAATSGSVTVTYQPDASGFAVSALQPPDLSQTVAATSTLTVLLVDAGGIPVYGATASCHIASAPQGSEGAAVSAAPKITGADGKASFQFTLGDKIGDYSVLCDVIDASGAAVNGSPVEFLFSSKADVSRLFIPDQSELTETPGGQADKDSKGRWTKVLSDSTGRKLIVFTDSQLTKIPADAKTKVEIKIKVYDIHGNPAPGITVKLNRQPADGRSDSKQAGAEQSQQQSVTDADGTVSFEDSSSGPGEFDYQASIGDALFGGSFRMAFAAVPLALDDVHIFPNPWRPGSRLCFAGNLSTSITLKITIYDIRGGRVRDIAGFADIVTLTPDNRQQTLWCGEGVNNGGRPLGSGVYIYYLEAWDVATGVVTTTKGKFSVVR